MSKPQPRFDIQKNKYISEPAGNIRLLTRKSSKSRIVDSPPNGWSDDNILNPNTQGNDNTDIIIILISTAFFLVILNFSTQQVSIFSNNAITVENAAKVINRKNKLPQMLPPFIEVNTLGNVMNIRLGPLSGSTLKAKHDGNMISPAIIATNVSSRAIFIDSPKRVRDLSM